MFNLEDSNPTLTGCDFAENLALVRGGAVRNNKSNPTFQSCDFSDNYSADTGGAVHNYMSSPVFEDCTFSNNEADERGGGMQNNEKSNPVLSNCVFRGNSSGDRGGAMLNNKSVPILTGCLFEENSTSEFGGAMWNENSGKFTLSNCTFVRNHAGIQGGAIFNMRSRPTISDCDFLMNSCGKSSYGGGVFCLWGSSVTMTRCRFSGNSSSRGGGFCSYQSGPKLINCIFEGNRANWGGAFYTFNHNVNSGSNIKMINCTFSGNTAKDGRSISCNSSGDAYPSNLDITGCIFRNGGNEIRNEDGTTIAITYTDIEGGWPGVGNFDADPAFAQMGYWDDPEQTPEDSSDDVWIGGDYHLRSQAGRYDAAGGGWVYDDVTSSCIDAGGAMSAIGAEPFPNGGVVNVGAYGGTAEASKSYFGQTPCETVIAGDINGDCLVDFRDFRIMSLHWGDDNNH